MPKVSIPKKIVVDRERWLTPDVEEESYLCSPDSGRMCCLGFACEQAGVSESYMEGRKMPPDLFYDGFKVEQLVTVDGRNSSEFARLAADINDDINISNEEREEQLKRLFSRYGYELVFIN